MANWKLGCLATLVVLAIAALGLWRIYGGGNLQVDGEINTTPIAYYADTRLGGSFSLDDPMQANGEITITEMDQFNGGTSIGFFDQSDAKANRTRNAVHLVVQEPNQFVSGLRFNAGLYLNNGVILYGT